MRKVSHIIPGILHITVGTLTAPNQSREKVSSGLKEQTTR